MAGGKLSDEPDSRQVSIVKQRRLGCEQIKEKTLRILSKE